MIYCPSPILYGASFNEYPSRNAFDSRAVVLTKRGPSGPCDAACSQVCASFPVMRRLVSESFLRELHCVTFSGGAVTRAGLHRPLPAGGSPSTCVRRVPWACSRPFSVVSSLPPLQAGLAILLGSWHFLTNVFTQSLPPQDAAASLLSQFFFNFP